MITLICDSSAETHLITNIKAFDLRSLTISPDLSGDNRIKVEVIVSKSDMTKVVGYLREHYVKQYNGYMIFVTDYIPA